VDQTAGTICVIDDDVSVRKALRRLLRSAGLAVETFGTAEDFLLWAGPGEPGCLVLDVCMPGMGGLELQQFLAAHGRPVPIIFVTGHEDEAARRRALQGGAVAFFYKPFDRQALLDALGRALART
jgi:FixJ family two-component response regulator